MLMVLTWFSIFVSKMLSMVIPFSDDYRATKFAMKSFYYIRLFKANEIHKNSE